MARTRITPIDIPIYGGGVTLTGTAGDASNGMVMANDGKTYLVCENTDSSTHVVTVVSVPDQFGRTNDTAMTVPVVSGSVPGKSVAGPFPPELFNQALGTDIHIDLSAATGMRLYACRSLTPGS